jgi:protoporphyrinogen oxidase
MRVAVVGGGISGLTIARQLVRRGVRAVVFEKGRPGGLAGGFLYRGSPGVYLDKFYHHIFTSDRRVVELIDEHRLGDDLAWFPSKSGLIAGGRTWRFESPLDLIRFAPLGPLGQRLRMGWNLRHLTRTDDWRPLDGITCREFFARRGNLTGYENLWEPLLRQKFADAHGRIPASFLWGRVYPRAKSRERGRERLGYLKGGFQRLLAAMAESIRRGGGEVRTGEAVRHVSPGPRPEVTTTRAWDRFDRVVWTAALPLLARALNGPPAETMRKLGSVEYMAVTQLILVMDRRQSDFYWLNNLDRDITFGGLIEHTNLVPPEHYGGEHVLYVVDYHRPGDPRYAGKRAGEVLDYHLPSLGRVLPRFRREDVRRLYCIRDGFSSPLYDLAFSDRVPPHRGRLENVDYCGMAQVYPVDRNMNHCVENALRYVEEFFPQRRVAPRREATAAAAAGCAMEAPA